MITIVVLSTLAIVYDRLSRFAQSHTPNSAQECSEQPSNPMDNSQCVPAMCDIVSVYCPDNDLYYTVNISLFHEGEHTVKYDDGYVAGLDLAMETKRFCNVTPHVHTSPDVVGDQTRVLSDILNYVGNRSSMRHKAQRFPSHSTNNAHSPEETEFKFKCQMVPLEYVLKVANDISSYLFYKVKLLDEQASKLKVRVVPHGNEESQQLWLWLFFVLTCCDSYSTFYYSSPKMTHNKARCESSLYTDRTCKPKCIQYSTMR